MMTLQLEVGKTYRARNGDVVRIVEKKEWGMPYFGDNGINYDQNGRSPFGFDVSAHDLIEEISADFVPIFRTIRAIDNLERAEAEAMERIRESLAELRAAVETAQKVMRGEG